MGPTVEAATRWVPDRSSGWLSGLFDYKAFLVALCLLPTRRAAAGVPDLSARTRHLASLTDATIGEPGQFIGLDNFVSLAQDPVFWMSVTNTIMLHRGRHRRQIRARPCGSRCC